MKSRKNGGGDERLSEKATRATRDAGETAQQVATGQRIKEKARRTAVADAMVRCGSVFVGTGKERHVSERGGGGGKGREQE